MTDGTTKPQARFYSADSVSGRALWLLALESASSIPRDLELGAANFACLVLAPEEPDSDADIEQLLNVLLLEGASYLMFWGPRCSRIEAIADMMLSDPDTGPSFSGAAHVMTTSHAESLDDALWFALNVAWPDDALFDTTTATLIVSIGQQVLAARVETALLDPRGFSASVLLDEQRRGGSEC